MALRLRARRLCWRGSARTLLGKLGSWVLVAVVPLALPASAGDLATQCKQARGAYVEGIVVKPPRFVPGKQRDGVELSHTRLSIKRPGDPKIWDVAINNVFVEGGDGQHVPPPLATIAKGERLSLCGRPYTKGVGLHWVHTNCGDRAHTHGWVRRFDASGKLGPNLAAVETFCSIFKD